MPEATAPARPRPIRAPKGPYKPEIAVDFALSSSANQILATTLIAFIINGLAEKNINVPNIKGQILYSPKNPPILIQPPISYIAAPKKIQ